MPPVTKTFRRAVLLATTLTTVVMQTAEAKPSGSNSEPTNTGLFSGTVVVKPELHGKHPRLFVSETGLQSAINRCRTDEPWRKHYFRPDGIELKTIPRPIKLSDRDLPCAVLAKLALSYALHDDPAYAERFQEWLPLLRDAAPAKIRGIGGDAADLFCGQMLTSLAISYDLLKSRVPPDAEKILYTSLVTQARQTYADLIALRRYPYEQNHFTIPVCGLLLASLALLDEEPEASAWAVWASNALRRCLEVLSPDGWFFESMDYWGYTMQFPVPAAYALWHTTGENLLEAPTLKNSPLYLAHNYLPVRNFVFDFADWGPRVHPDGRTAQNGYDHPWHTNPTKIPIFIPALLNRVSPDPLLDAFLEGRRSTDTRLDGIISSLLQLPVTHTNKQPSASPNPPASPASPALPTPYHYFNDMEVIHWRENWHDTRATAIAYKSGPPGGHAMTSLLRQYPDWKPSLGHAHPDAGSFILFSKGVFLANDTGYAVKETAWHNSILVNGTGQMKGGTAWQTFKNIPYKKLNRIRMENVWLGRRIIAGTADFAAAYDDSLGLTEMRRDLVMVGGRYLVISDAMGASSPNEYEWRLHSDQAAVEDGPERFVMTNGTGRLAIRNLHPVASKNVAPTIVETELYELATRSRPQQRGHHLALKSPRTARATFLVAMNIQSSDENAQKFHAQEIFPGKTELTDEAGSCTVWTGNSAELRGSFAYVLRDAQGTVISAGLHGSELNASGISITQKDKPGAVALDLDSGSGAWSIENMTTHANRPIFEIDGQRQTIVMFKP
ncbi:DUF4962 domain-containing protein [Opitutaceae bacterium TAV4]|nr:DUF4962 domain-containing protein [Opitutaceae bacterium TAV4]RRJ99916.1 DUF4962 domain-containing protein [Opitutaceae bacterium TAV3]